MTNQQILEKAIGKAIKNGLDVKKANVEGLTSTEILLALRQVGYPPKDVKESYASIMLFAGIGQRITNEVSWRHLIFNHNFAKALWGEEEKHAINQAFDQVTKMGWKQHLQEMVIAGDPIKYLGNNL